MLPTAAEPPKNTCPPGADVLPEKVAAPEDSVNEMGIPPLLSKRDESVGVNTLVDMVGKPGKLVIPLGAVPLIGPAMAVDDVFPPTVCRVSGIEAKPLANDCGDGLRLNTTKLAVVVF